MILVFNIKDPKNSDWAGFWKAIADDPTAEVQRFGFRMYVRDLATDATRIATECATRMRWAKDILRAEDYATMRKNYQAVRDCKSNRAIGNAERTRERNDQVRTRLNEYVRDLLN